MGDSLSYLDNLLYTHNPLTIKKDLAKPRSGHLDQTSLVIYSPLTN